MADREPLVALLFDDAALSADLRDALLEHGAHIVYESDLASFAPAELVGSSADVVVVDLDDPSDEDLDRLYDTVEGGHPRLVFNDADATRGLDGWDRARWARHLASKLIGQTQLDPPRPEDARAIEPRLAALASVPAPAEETFADAVVEDISISGIHGYPATPMMESDAVMSLDDAPDIEGDVHDEMVFSTALVENDEEGQGLEPADLAAELEALLADSASDVDHSDGIDSVPSAPVELTELAFLDLSGFEVAEDAPSAVPPTSGREFDLSRFSLASMEDGTLAATSGPAASVEIESRATGHVPAPAPEWDLVDHDALVVQVPGRDAPADFGIETLSAAEFLAHDVVDDGTHDLVPGLSLELMSMEDAVAPHVARTSGHEMFLEGSSRAVRRVIALAGTRESEASIAAFLAAVPTSIPAVVLVVMHHEGEASAVASRLGGLRLASDQTHATHGERLLVSRGSTVQVRRDGSVVVGEDNSSAYAAGPSIDRAFATLAAGFGNDGLAIVFAGHGNDAIAGAQAIYDAGGKVWVESVAPEAGAGHMVAGIREERVAAFAGDVAALAQKLIEEFP